MAPRRVNRPDDLQIAVAHALGYPDYPSDLTAEPYLNYIANHHTGRGTLQDYLRLFIRVIEHFTSGQKQATIRALLHSYAALVVEDLFSDTKPGSTERKDDVEDTVMYIIGVWVAMWSSFVRLPNGSRKVAVAYNIRAPTKGKKTEAYDDALAGLIRQSCLLPAPSQASETDPENDIAQIAMKLVALVSQSCGTPAQPGTSLNTSMASWGLGKGTNALVSSQSLDGLDSLESLSIKATRVNAFTLNMLGAVTVSWTHNVSRHMLLCYHGGRYTLEIFALPCVFNASTLTSEAVGISTELVQEIQESYCILFNAWPDMPWHARFGRFLGIRKFCWCWPCSARRYRLGVIARYRNAFGAKTVNSKRSRKSHKRSEYDPSLVDLMNKTEATEWTQELFPCLWSRVTALEEHLQRAKPWSIWILFRDRRDTLQFWTFFFATIVLLLTFLQVALGVAQVFGSFR